MGNFFTNKRLITLLTFVILFVGLIGFSIRDREEVTVPEQFIRDVIGSVQFLIQKPVEKVGAFVQSVIHLDNTYEENKYLKSKVGDFAELSVRVNELERENNQLRETLKVEKSLNDIGVLHSSIIARNPEQWDALIFINKGRQHGVKKNMAVISPEGLIGKISQISEFTSSVQLLTADEHTNRISSVIQSKEPLYGIIEGYDVKKQSLLLKKIPADAKVKKGEKVVTSGLGGIFPRGLLIGEVTESFRDDYGLTQTVYVKPSADFYDMNNVMVIERVMPEPSNELINGEGDKK